MLFTRTQYVLCVWSYFAQCMTQLTFFWFRTILLESGAKVALPTCWILPGICLLGQRCLNPIWIIPVMLNVTHVSLSMWRSFSNFNHVLITSFPLHFSSFTSPFFFVRLCYHNDCWFIGTASLRAIVTFISSLWTRSDTWYCRFSFVRFCTLPCPIRLFPFPSLRLCGGLFISFGIIVWKTTLHFCFRGLKV